MTEIQWETELAEHGNPKPPSYFDRFFEETDKAPFTMWEIDTATDTHMIDSDFVIELIKGTTGNEAQTIERQLTVLDFKNAPILPFLKFLAQAYITAHYGPVVES